MANDKSYQIKVEGLVQGVFFRKSTKEKAKELGLKGFVQNERDGSVYMEAEGEAGPLRQLLKWARKGPPQARVSGVKSTEQDLKAFTDFEVRQS